LVRCRPGWAAGTHTDRNTHGCADRYTHGRANCNSDGYSDVHGDRDSYGDRDGDRDVDSDVHADFDVYGYVHTDCDVYGHVHTDTGVILRRRHGGSYSWRGMRSALWASVRRANVRWGDIRARVHLPMGGYLGMRTR
jgi:hypothetical protein